MLRLPRPEHFNPVAAERRLERAGFHAVAFEDDGDDLLIHGATENRTDEWGGHAIIGEEDRTAVRAILDVETARANLRGQVRNLRAKPTMTQPEMVEAIRLLMDLVLDTED